MSSLASVAECVNGALQKQNRSARNVNFLGQYRRFASSRAILQFAAPATRPQNAGRKTREITGKNALLAQPRRAAMAVPGRGFAKSSPVWRKHEKSFEKNRPTFAKTAQKSKKRVSFATRRNSQPNLRILLRGRLDDQLGDMRARRQRGDHHDRGRHVGWL